VQRRTLHEGDDGQRPGQGSRGKSERQIARTWGIGLEAIELLAHEAQDIGEAAVEEQRDAEGEVGRGKPPEAQRGIPRAWRADPDRVDAERGGRFDEEPGEQNALDRRAEQSCGDAAVSRSPMGKSSWMRISPASIRSSITCQVTPCQRSPLRIAHEAALTPAYRGSGPLW
jgi:hypothetical protein